MVAGSGEQALGCVRAGKLATHGGLGEGAEGERGGEGGGASNGGQSSCGGVIMALSGHCHTSEGSSSTCESW